MFTTVTVGLNDCFCVAAVVFAAEVESMNHSWSIYGTDPIQTWIVSVRDRCFW